MPVYSITFWSAISGRPVVLPLPEFDDLFIEAAACTAQAEVGPLLIDGAQGTTFPAFVVFENGKELGGN